MQDQMVVQTCEFTVADNKRALFTMEGLAMHTVANPRESVETSLWKRSGRRSVKLRIKGWELWNGEVCEKLNIVWKSVGGENGQSFFYEKDELILAWTPHKHCACVREAQVRRTSRARFGTLLRTMVQTWCASV